MEYLYRTTPHIGRLTASPHPDHPHIGRLTLLGILVVSLANLLSPRRASLARELRLVAMLIFGWHAPDRSS